jgi:DNA-binding NarL/FixJ family response regulator
VNSFLIDTLLRVRAPIENLILSERLFLTRILARKGDDVNHALAKLAILEDHPMMREALAHTLVLHSHDIDISYKGASINECLSAHDRDKFSIAILDLDLGDGSDPLENIKALLAEEIKVIIVSALAKPQIVRQALKIGAAAYVSKNAEPEALREAISATLKGDQYMSPDIAIALLSDESITVELSKQEQQALSLYASGMKLDAVARAMNISRSTASEYIQRARKKYTKAGINLPTKTDLYRQAQQDGLLK